MSQVKINFLNWKPDVEDYENDGLITAENLIHQPEGYITVPSATNNSAYTDGVRTVNAMICRPIGTSGQQLQANVYYSTGPPLLGWVAVGSAVSGNEFTSVGLGTLVSQNAMLTAFEVCELDNKVFAVARAEASLAVGTLVSANIAGFFTVTSA